MLIELPDMFAVSHYIVEKEQTLIAVLRGIPGLRNVEAVDVGERGRVIVGVRYLLSRNDTPKLYRELVQAHGSLVTLTMGAWDVGNLPRCVTEPVDAHKNLLWYGHSHTASMLSLAELALKDSFLNYDALPELAVRQVSACTAEGLIVDAYNKREMRVRAIDRATVHENKVRVFFSPTSTHPKEQEVEIAYDAKEEMFTPGDGHYFDTLEDALCHAFRECRRLEYAFAG
jgi:hypothetical protein